MSRPLFGDIPRTVTFTSLNTENKKKGKEARQGLNWHLEFCTADTCRQQHDSTQRNLRDQITTKSTGETEKRKVDPPRLIPVGCLVKRNGL